MGLLNWRPTQRPARPEREVQQPYARSKLEKSKRIASWPYGPHAYGRIQPILDSQHSTE